MRGSRRTVAASRSPVHVGRRKRCETEPIGDLPAGDRGHRPAPAEAPAQAATPIWSPAGGVLLFTSDRLGSWDLWVYASGAAGPLRAISGPVWDRSLRQAVHTVGQTHRPAQSPAGRRVHHRCRRAGRGRDGPGAISRADLPRAGWPSAHPHQRSRAGRDAARGHLRAAEPGAARRSALVSSTQGPPNLNESRASQRRELFAVALSEAGEHAVQLTDDPRFEPTGDPHWAVDDERRLVDGRVSWLAQDSRPGTRPGAASDLLRACGVRRGGHCDRPARAAQRAVRSCAESHDWSPTIAGRL